MSLLAENKKARFDYEILQEYEAGLVLSGKEVKAAKTGQISLKGSFVKIKQGEAYLTNALISLYKKSGPDPDYEPTRNRKLLLKKKELNELIGRKQSEGLTIVPLSVYTKGTLVKAKIALARGKRKYDKRETIKKKDIERKIQQRIKQ